MYLLFVYYYSSLIYNKGREEKKRKSVREKKEKGEEKKKEKDAKRLTSKQRELLELVFRFRFVTAADAATYFNQPYLSGIWTRLEKLVAIGMVAKRYNGEYKIHGRAAEYYCTPQARYELRHDMKNVSEREIKQLYRRSEASERFVQRSRALLRIYLDLRACYGERLKMVTKIGLNCEQYDYFPRPLPDAFITLENDEGKKRYFFLDYYDDDISLGIHARRLRLYSDYEETGEWDDTGVDFPGILAICESPRLTKRFVKRVRHFVNNEWTELDMIRVACIDDLVSDMHEKHEIWTDPLNESDGNVALLQQEKD